MSQSELSNGQQPQVAGFVGKTFQILNNQEYSKIIFWGHSGKEFVIKDINKFQQIVLPKYFRHKKINSFIRQLNMYGFHKSRKDNSKSIFSHPNFLKDRQDLLPTIKRKIKCFDVPQTPKKPKMQLPSKLMLETAAKEAESLKKIPQFPSHNLLKGIFQSKQYLGSRFNLNVSLIKISMNELDHCQKKSQTIQDDKLSIEFQIQNRNEDFPEGGNIVNPSFFFNSFKEYAIK